MITLIPLTKSNGFLLLSGASENLFVAEHDPADDAPLRYFESIYGKTQVDWSRYCDVKTRRICTLTQQSRQLHLL